MLRSGKSRTKDLPEMSFIALFRGAAHKTELSLVDKIELARTYKNLTGNKMLS